ncbi:MAG: hypothetical protein JWN58_1597 [Gammaproteobacteria bacterium]|nr:hypothetical protein [Gammaproteobacteria bacterium]
MAARSTVAFIRTRFQTELRNWRLLVLELPAAFSRQLANGAMGKATARQTLPLSVSLRRICWLSSGSASYGLSAGCVGLTPSSPLLPSTSSNRMKIPPAFRAQAPLCRSRALMASVLAGSIAGLLLLGSPNLHAETFVPTTATGTWNLATNWAEGAIPNGIGASALFNSPTVARAVTLDSAITVGSLLLIINTNFSNTLSNGTGGSLTLDAAGTGPATITTDGTTTALITLSATQIWTDSVTVNTISTTSTSAAGALTLTGLVSGAGGFTKQGGGTVTFGTAAKNYAGPTVISGGRLRLSAIGSPALSSSMTVASGGHVPAVFWGPLATIGFSHASGTLYQHQSMLLTVMDTLGLPNPPGAAATAPPMSEFLQ